MSVFLGLGFLFRLLPKAPRWSRPKRHIKKFHLLIQGCWQQERRFFFFRNPSTSSACLCAGDEMKQPTTETLCGPFRHNIRSSADLLWKPTTYSTMASNEEDVNACDGSHFDICPSAAMSELSPLLSLFDLLIRHQNCGLGQVWECHLPFLHWLI